ncbi:N(2)-fixation sustaining protein CowN [uncultured Thiohalocapsa sp.]|jgi:hypothetical protein|uniref:N(2)-fixation sustaining protein CowN n=1 Tax=uncultured Thiohalocapsa sp. TaxID=768990 RepID=UPI0025E0DFB4|nr:N(2)-fixation sustaining protein CowN [uncultured Thiohalocapsa sp.]
MTASRQPEALDRYLSFIGLDCDGKAERLAAAMREALDRDADAVDPFWHYFRAKLDGERGPAHDALYHIHANLNPVREMLLRAERPDLLERLESLEHECC